MDEIYCKRRDFFYAINLNTKHYWKSSNLANVKYLVEAIPGSRIEGLGDFRQFIVIGKSPDYTNLLDYANKNFPEYLL